MQGNPCYARLFADLTRTPQGAFSYPFGTIHLVSPNPIKASGGQSRAPPVAGEARRKPSEQGSARKAPRADAARPLGTALRPPNPQGFFDRLTGAFGPCFGFTGGGPLARPCKTPPPPAQTLQQRSWQPGKGRRKGASWRRLPWRQGRRWDARGGRRPGLPLWRLGQITWGQQCRRARKIRKNIDKQSPIL